MKKLYTLRTNSSYTSKKHSLNPRASWIKQIFFIFSLCVLILTSVFMGYKNAKLDMFNSDAVSDNNFLQTPFIAGDIHVQAIHTHLLKWPLMLLENAFGFSTSVHIVISVLLLLAMNLWLGYIFYIISKRNIMATSLGLLLLANVELLMGINGGEFSLSMLTIRNIELPAMITLIWLSLKSKRMLSARTLFLGFAFGILFVSDLLLLYTTVIGAVLYLMWRCLKRQSISVALRENEALYGTVILGIIFCKLITFIFGYVGIAQFCERANLDLAFVKSFPELFNYVLIYTGKLFDVFGASFFNKQVTYAWLYIITVPLLLVSAFLTHKFIRGTVTKKNIQLNTEEKLLLLLLAMYIFSMLIFTIIIPRETAGRYFAFAPVIGIMLVMYYLRNWSAFMEVKYQRTMLVLGMTVVLLFFGKSILTVNQFLYNSRLNPESVVSVERVVDILAQNKISVYIDTDYWRNHIIKTRYDRNGQEKLAIPLTYCGSAVVDKQFSKRSWALASDKEVAIRAKECDTESIEAVFGTPDRIITLNQDSSDLLLIYKRDVRSILDLREYEPGFVK